MVERLKVVGVMGSGSERHEALAHPLGRMLAGLGVHLLTGGGQGVMDAVAEAFTAVEERTGRCLGVLPGRLGDEGCEAPPGYPNRHVEIAMRTHLPGRGEEGGTPLSRNSINIASSDAVVVLPGKAGTASEARLALRMRKPAIGFGGGGAAEGIVQGAAIEDVEDYLRAVLGL